MLIPHGFNGIYMEDLPSDFNYKGKTLMVLMREKNERTQFLKLIPNERSIVIAQHGNEEIKLRKLKKTSKWNTEEWLNKQMQKYDNIIIVDEFNYARWNQYYDGSKWIKNISESSESKLVNLGLNIPKFKDFIIT